MILNIRAGNTLVGYATREAVKQAITTAQHGQIKLLSTEEMDTLRRIEEKAQDVDRLFGLFRQQQTALGGEVTPADKQELRDRLRVLEDELNHYLAGEYGAAPVKRTPTRHGSPLTSHSTGSSSFTASLRMAGLM
jgi:hypothetical protein